MRSSCLNKCLNILNLFIEISVWIQEGIQCSTLSFIDVIKWKPAVDNRKSFGAVLTDLSKALDCLWHGLLIAKLNAYGFSITASRVVQNDLSNCKQKTKINYDFSSWEEILLRVPQGSILGPLLLKIFLCYTFFIMNETDFPSYADDNTPYVVGNNRDVIINLQNASLTLL